AMRQVEWANSTHWVPSPLWTAYNETSGELWNLTIGEDDCYVYLYAEIWHRA
ncbi:uncharacterized protein METZ01_LOCUS279935, partial [marine metagenome]